MTAAPMWTPDPAAIELTGMDRFRRAAQERAGTAIPDSAALHRWSVEQPAAFWSLVWDFMGIVGVKGERVHVPSTLPDAVFFPDATLNLAENLLHLCRPDDPQTPVLIAVDEAGTSTSVTHERLVARVAAMAALLRDRGVVAGDRVAVVLPVGFDALTVTLGALSIGAVVTTAAPEFGVPTIVDRFGQLDPVILVGAASYSWSGRNFARATELAELARQLPSVREVLVTADTGATVELGGVTTTRLHEALAAFDGAAPDFARLAFDHPAYVMFSSGTTGRPKCLVHRAGGVLLKNLTETVLHGDVRRGDRLMYYTTTGWMLWNWVISAMGTGCAIVTYDGAPNYPSMLRLFDIAARERLTHLGMSSRFTDLLRTSGEHPGRTPGLDALRVILVTGSPLSATTAQWLADEFDNRVHVGPISGGTDLLGCFIACDPTRPAYAGQMQGPALGLDIDVLDDDGRPLRDGTEGELVCRNTFPSVPLRIWGDDDGSRLHSTYFEQFPGVWTHGDLASWTEQGGLVVHGRSDATLNAGGVRIGTGEIYSALDGMAGIGEMLAFAQAWDDDSRIILLIVPASGHAVDDDLRDRIRATLRARCSPRHVPARILEVDALPRTLTGKLAEIAVSEAVNGRAVRGRAALANPEALDLITALPGLTQ